jgi:hypothetical protein
MSSQAVTIRQLVITKNRIIDTSSRLVLKVNDMNAMLINRLIVEFTCRPIMTSLISICYDDMTTSCSILFTCWQLVCWTMKQIILVKLLCSCVVREMVRDNKSICCMNKWTCYVKKNRLVASWWLIQSFIDWCHCRSSYGQGLRYVSHNGLCIL